jgi:structure-specific recognition protein 1
MLFNSLVGIKKIIVPGDFKSSKGAKAISCSVKAAEGHLFPLKSSLVFIHKPVLYIRHSELKHVEFGRTV